MDKNYIIFYLAIGFGLLFLIPAAESVGDGLGQLATFLVIGYWGLMGFCFLLFILKNMFAEYGFGNMLYNLWFFLSIMCVAVGALAIVDDGIDKAPWAVLLILYGGTIGYLKRNEL